MREKKEINEVILIPQIYSYWLTFETGMTPEIIHKRQFHILTPIISPVPAPDHNGKDIKLGTVIKSRTSSWQKRCKYDVQLS